MLTIRKRSVKVLIKSIESEMFRAALSLVLDGEVYHMMTVAMDRPDHHHLWRKALAGSISK